MRKRRAMALIAGLLTIGWAWTGCEWSGGGDSGFNTTRGAVNVNFSGVYEGRLGGGKAVSQTSGATISRFVIQQSGNVIDITDSNGQMYRGVVGSPGGLQEFGTQIPAGVAVAVFQITWSGKDGVAAKDVDFTGVIDLVAVENVNADTSATTINNTTSTSTDESTTANTSSTIATNASGEIVVLEPTGNNTTNIIQIPGTVDISQSTTTDASSNQNATSGKDTARTIDTTFSLTANNSQLRLRGTWIEQGGFVSEVSAISPGNGILFGQLDFGSGSGDNNNQGGNNNTGGGGLGGGNSGGGNSGGGNTGGGNSGGGNTGGGNTGGGGLR
jgi:hypothetical protein